MEDLKEVKGTVERITFHSTDSGYCVLRIRVDGVKDLLTVVGNIAKIAVGESVEAKGVWSAHPEFGRQFKAEKIETGRPSSLEAIERYLGSGMLKGVGPHYAAKLVKAFGYEVFNVLDREPERLKRVTGIGPAKVRTIQEAWKTQSSIRDIMVFLQTYGISPARSVRIYKTYGSDAIAKVRANPYRLVRDVPGIGFLGADQIAKQMGVAVDSPLRIGAGIHHALLLRVNDGNVAYPRDRLVSEAAELLAVDHSKVVLALSSEIEDGHLVSDGGDRAGVELIYPKALYEAEVKLARQFLKMAKLKASWTQPDDWNAQISKAENELKLALDTSQRAAVEMALSSRLMLLTGGPGTGKTTITRVILHVLKKMNLKIALASPTGRAARRLTEVTGMEASTIHRLLGVDRVSGEFLHSEELPVEAQVCLVDEASMVDLPLMNHLVSALSPGCALILVGDVDQIPSVGPGEVLASLIRSQQVHFTRLTEIYRQAAESEIIRTAYSINRGEVPNLEPRAADADFHFIESRDAAHTLRTLAELVKTRIPKKLKIDAKRDVQVLVPMNRGGLGTRAINLELQKILNPEPVGKVERFGTVFGVGDKVMVTLNDYDKEVFNGDIGRVTNIDDEEEILDVDFDGRIVRYEWGELDSLTLAYCITIHKSQGSEYPAAVIVLTMQHRMMLKRNLVYTAATRGKRMVVVLGSREALRLAVQSGDGGSRFGKLAERINEAILLP